eukprot:6236476-Lingulodinium_polyedra.AAC.1
MSRRDLGCRRMAATLSATATRCSAGGLMPTNCRQTAAGAHAVAMFSCIPVLLYLFGTHVLLAPWGGGV